MGTAAPGGLLALSRRPMTLVGLWFGSRASLCCCPRCLHGAEQLCSPRPTSSIRPRCVFLPSKHRGAPAWAATGFFLVLSSSKKQQKASVERRFGAVAPGAGSSRSVPGLCARQGRGSLERGRWVPGDRQQVRKGQECRP